MKDINKLLIKAKQRVEPNKEKLIFGIIEHENKMYKLKCVVWDGIRGNGGRDIESCHNTYDEVEREAYKIGEEYPNDKEVKIIVIDYSKE